MHKYLRSIGFRSFTNESLDRLYYKAINEPDRVSSVRASDGSIYTEFRIAAAKGVGIAFRGRQSGGEKFRLEYYFPYAIGSALSTKEKLELFKESDREGYYGICDELNLGVELIFFLQDMISDSDEPRIKNGQSKPGGIRLAALASEGTILFPIRQTVRQVKRVRETNTKKRNLMAAARNGDEDAMEQLAREEMDMYACVARRAETEDIFSIVNSYFMPEGIESDKYSILGTITALRMLQNTHTNEVIYILTLNCNRVRFDVCINSKDLLGEPAVGRRLKAKIWMQGMIHGMSL